MTKPDFPQGICAGMRYTVSMTKPLAETAFDGLVMVSKTFIGVVAGVALVLSAWLLVILWTAPNEDGGAPSTSVVYPLIRRSRASRSIARPWAGPANLA
jgi:hypothetical protein